MDKRRFALMWVPGLVMAVGLLVSAAASAESLGSTLDVYVFPAAGQETSQQNQDEAACYEWAVGEVGSDPFDLMKDQEAANQQAQAEQQAASGSTQGAGARGAVTGAARGAVIGEIADDDPGEGAAWGAAVGGVTSRRKARRGQQEAAAQSQQQQQASAQATEAEIDNFKKAFSVCLEAKEYMVKY